MRTAPRLHIFNSYNCFYSCLGTMLKGSYGWGLNTVLHTQWQFFYDRKWTYDQDNRFVGEYPAPYDKAVFNKFKEVFQLKLIENKDEINEDLLEKIQLDLEKNGASLFLVNKFFYNKIQGKYPISLLTTILITDIDYNNKRMKFIMGDDHLTFSSWISIHRFYQSLKKIPHNRSEGGSRFTFTGQTLAKGIKDQRKVINHYAPAYMLESAETFLKGSENQNQYRGIRAIEVFARDILSWSEKKRLYLFY